MAEKKVDVKWSDIKRQVHSLDGAALLPLIQGLFKLSVENRAFLAAHLLGASASRALLPPTLSGSSVPSTREVAIPN